MNTIVAVNLNSSVSYWAVMGLTNNEYEIVSVWESRTEAELAADIEAELNDEYVSLTVRALC